MFKKHELTIENIDEKFNEIDEQIEFSIERLNITRKLLNSPVSPYLPVLNALPPRAHIL